MLDMINALEVLAEGLTTADELIDRIDEIFPKKDKKSGIALSTIHKAKGLEANNVYVACKSLMPSKSAKKDWELKQEYNLMYVAYTRAKNILGFIDEKDFEKFTSGENSSNQLNKIETLVNSLYGKKPIYDLNNSNDVKTIVERIKDVQTNISSSSKIKIINKNNENKINNFSDILKKKKRKTVRL
jgi:ATP-dependent exoDNAse (exonuclease V) beta subunit